MVKAKRGLIFLTCLTSALSAIVCLLSFGTQNWIEAKGTYGSLDGYNIITYGLFTGSFKRNVGSVSIHEIVMTCLISDNVCAMLCKSTSEDRKWELQKLYNNDKVTFDTDCPQVFRSNYRPIPATRILREDVGGERTFISAASFIFTAFFLIVSAVFGLAAAVLAVWNTAGNPIYTVFSIYGMQIYNIVGAVTVLLTIIVWGAEYNITIISNACILETIIGDMSTIESNLGYSYWILFVPLVLYPTSAGILYLRQYLINKEPEKQVDIQEDGDIIMY
ncbi:PREDICTED: uncharacterized protein LOC108564570 [Nicrophorus vespilloides]|uniref:Uncharacterized protein LOC108564570 n=1 Tax=Nicrophorus vespilloides TaxID=110193 RepID=A0ABM1MX42_NICVS|nr:PREDICTED: uncharacterized protein LOC108564570 [Nicrophorus vespilloides]